MWLLLPCRKRAIAWTFASTEYTQNSSCQVQSPHWFILTSENILLHVAKVQRSFPMVACMSIPVHAALGALSSAGTCESSPSGKGEMGCKEDWEDIIATI